MTKHCEHVYKNMNANPCPLCGRDTHETDWKEQHRLQKKWLEENPDAGKYGGWWSI